MPSGEKQEKRKRVNLTVLQKIELIKKLESGLSVKDVCEEYGVKKQTVSDIRKAKHELFEYAAKHFNDGVKNTTKRKHMKSANLKQLDEAVYKWCVQEKSRGNKLTSGSIRNACNDFCANLGVEFKISDGWLYRFRNRYGLNFGQTKGKTCADKVVIENYRLQLNELIKKEDLLMSQIYNADESGIFWRSLPNNTYARRLDDVVKGKKLCKSKISILFCANADGMHRLKPVIVGKSSRTLHDQLAAHYYNSKNTWFNSSIITDWFLNHFVPEVKKYQEEVLKFHPNDIKALLLLDNAGIHPETLTSDDGKIRVMFLPENSTSLIQPMEQSIITSCKRRYFWRFLNEVMISGTNDGKSLEMLQKLQNYSIKSAIYNLANSWQDLKISLLANSWKKLLINTDFDYDFNGYEAEDFYRLLQNFGEQEVALKDVEDWLDENESDGGFQVLPKDVVVLSSDEEEEELEVTLPSFTDVRNSLDILLKYVEYSDDKNIRNHYAYLKSLQDAVIKEKFVGNNEQKSESFFRANQDSQLYYSLQSNDSLASSSQCDAEISGAGHTDLIEMNCSSEITDDPLYDPNLTSHW